MHTCRPTRKYVLPTDPVLESEELLEPEVKGTACTHLTIPNETDEAMTYYSSETSSLSSLGASG